MKRHIDLASIQQRIHLEPSSPLKGNKSPELSLTPRQLAKYYSFSQYPYINLINILQKQHSRRTHKELIQINQFIRKNSALAELAQINGMQYCKGIMRSALIQQYKKGQIVQQKDSILTKIYIILSGKLASIKTQKDANFIEHINQKEVYQMLVNIARKQRTKVGKLLRKFSTFRENKTFSHKQYLNQSQYQLLQTFEKDRIYGDKLLCFSKNATHTIITLQNSILLTIDIKNLFYWLNISFQSKLQQTYHLLNNHPCFSFIQSQNLYEIIQILTINKVKKNEIVYQQGSQSNHIYFLQTGQLSIEKQTKLFMDNPNTLYMDRRKLMSEKELKNKQYLPYANLKTLYNLMPMTKTIQIGTINPVCIFGEQQIFENKTRDTTVRCKSIHATYYGIQIKKIAGILKDNMMQFIELIKHSLKQKVKYRQNNYANTINFQNKNNLQGFYHDNSIRNHNTRRNSLKKYNQKLSNNQKNNQNNNLGKTNSQIIQLIYSNRNQNNKQQKKYFPELRQQGCIKQIPPAYNNFNFHKMLKINFNKRVQSEKIMQQSSSQDSISKYPIGEQQSQQENEQFRIFQNSHTWREVKERVCQQQKFSTLFGSVKHKIDLNTPLIDSKYFQNIERKIKKLERQKKNNRLNFSSKAIVNKLNKLNNI